MKDMTPEVINVVLDCLRDSLAIACEAGQLADIRARKTRDAMALDISIIAAEKAELLRRAIKYFEEVKQREHELEKSWREARGAAPAVAGSMSPEKAIAKQRGRA